MPSLSTKGRKAKFNTDDLIFRKKSLIYQVNSLAPSKKYIMIEEFKDELRDLKNILNEIKKTGTIERTRNKLNKK